MTHEGGHPVVLPERERKVKHVYDTGVLAKKGIDY